MCIPGVACERGRRAGGRRIMRAPAAMPHARVCTVQVQAGVACDVLPRGLGACACPRVRRQRPSASTQRGCPCWALLADARRRTPTSTTARACLVGLNCAAPLRATRGHARLTNTRAHARGRACSAPCSQSQHAQASGSQAPCRARAARSGRSARVPGKVGCEDSHTGRMQRATREQTSGRTRELGGRGCARRTLPKGPQSRPPRPLFIARRAGDGAASRDGSP